MKEEYKTITVSVRHEHQLQREIDEFLEKGYELIHTMRTTNSLGLNHAAKLRKKK